MAKHGKTENDIVTFFHDAGHPRFHLQTAQRWLYSQSSAIKNVYRETVRVMLELAPDDPIVGPPPPTIDPGDAILSTFRASTTTDKESLRRAQKLLKGKMAPYLKMAIELLLTVPGDRHKPS